MDKKKYKSRIQLKGGLKDDIRSALLVPVVDANKAAKPPKPFVLWSVHHR